MEDSPKLIIFFLILAVGSALFYKLDQITPVGKPSMVSTPTIYISLTPKLNLDLNGPLICQYTSKQSTISALIKNKSVFATKIMGKQETDYLLKGDCLYFWKKGQYSGEKICGLSSYLTLINIKPQFDLSSLPLGSHSAEIQNVIKSCKKKEIKDENIFELPKNVLFKNK